MLPQELMNDLPSIAGRIQVVNIVELEYDEVYWKGSSNGELTPKSAFEHYREKESIAP